MIVGGQSEQTSTMNNAAAKQVHSDGRGTSIAVEVSPTGDDTRDLAPEPLSILYFGNDWSAENRTSSHHIARWLARGNRVYYLECPGLRAPKGSARDLKKIWAKLFRFIRGPRPTPEGLKVWTLLQLPLHRFRLVRWLNRTLILGAVRWLKMAERVRNPVSWFLVPHLAGVVGRLGERLSVYYCIDDYSALPDVNEAAVRAMDEETTRKADLVFVASDTLLAAKRQLNPTTRVSPHGVDLDHFARAQQRPGRTAGRRARPARPGGRLLRADREVDRPRPGRLPRRAAAGVEFRDDRPGRGPGRGRAAAAEHPLPRASGRTTNCRPTAGGSTRRSSRTG